MTEEVKNLIAWQRAIELNKEIYKLVKQLPKEEIYALSDQMRRAVVSIPSNIAEGKGRHSVKEYSHFLSIALGSCYELETQLYLCAELGFIDKETTKEAADLCSEVCRLISGLIRSIESK